MKIKFDKEQVTVKTDIIGLIKYIFACLVLIVALTKCDFSTIMILCIVGFPVAVVYWAIQTENEV